MLHLVKGVINNSEDLNSPKVYKFKSAIET